MKIRILLWFVIPVWSKAKGMKGPIKVSESFVGHKDKIYVLIIGWGCYSTIDTPYVWEEATALQIVAGCEDDRWKDEVEEDRLVELEGSFAGEARRPVKNKGYQHSHENSDSWLMDTFDLGERWLTRLDSMMAAAMV